MVKGFSCKHDLCSIPKTHIRKPDPTAHAYSPSPRDTDRNITEASCLDRLLRSRFIKTLSQKNKVASN